MLSRRCQRSPRPAETRLPKPGCQNPGQRLARARSPPSVPPGLHDRRVILSARNRWSVFADTFRTQLWPVPLMAVLVAVAAGIAMPRLDAHTASGLPGWASTYLFGGGPDAARSVLQTVAGSLMTVTSLTFSLTVVTLQLASSQFSPRLLRTFTRDSFVHRTLALFLATFAFALTVLRTVRTEQSGTQAFVPKISVTISFLLAVASVVGLVLFLAHLVREIRVETMLAAVHTDGSHTLTEYMATRTGECGPPDSAPEPPVTAVTLPAGASGFLTTIAEERLLHAAVEHDVVLALRKWVGASVVAGTPMALAWPHSAGDRCNDDVAHRLAQCLHTSVSTGVERTSAQDIGLALRQLTDVAAKALSPGVNDPTTAVHALGHSAAYLGELAEHDLGTRLLRDSDGVVRVILAGPDFADMLELAVAAPRRYGCADLDVVDRLFGLLGDVAYLCRDDRQLAAVTAQLDRLRAGCAAQPFDDAERRRIAELDDETQRAVATAR